MREDKEKRLHDVPASMHGELSESQCQLDIMAHESIEAYKNSKECANVKRDYAATCYHYGRGKVWAKVLLKYLTLRLDFLDERANEDDNAEAPENPMDSPGDLPLTV